VKQRSTISRLQRSAAALLLFVLACGIAPLPAAAATTDPFTSKPVMTAAPTADQADPVMAGPSSPGRTGERAFSMSSPTIQTRGRSSASPSLSRYRRRHGRSQPALDGQTLVWVNTPAAGRDAGATAPPAAPAVQTRRSRV